MKQDVDWNLIVFYWNRLTYLQRKKIVWRVKCWRVKENMYVVLFYIFIITAKIITPMPVRRRAFVPAHYIGQDK